MAEARRSVPPIKPSVSFYVARMRTKTASQVRWKRLVLDPSLSLSLSLSLCLSGKKRKF